MNEIDEIKRLCADGAFIHVVCGVGGDVLWLITAYYPDPAEWMPGFAKRKERTQ